MDSGPHYKSYKVLGSLGTAVPETYEQYCIKKNERICYVGGGRFVFWKCMQVWVGFGSLGIVVLIGLEFCGVVWSWLELFGVFWKSIGKYGEVWGNLGKFGEVWGSLASLTCY